MKRLSDRAAAFFPRMDRTAAIRATIAQLLANDSRSFPPHPPRYRRLRTTRWPPGMTIRDREFTMMHGQPNPMPLGPLPLGAPIPQAPDSLAPDLLRGAAQIAAFLFGDRGRRRRVYHLVETSRLPYFRIGSVLCARRSVLFKWIADQEARTPRRS